jgi:hypothetical protein
MTSSNRLGFFFTLAALAVGFWGSAQKATALVIYQENFTGSASTALNGSPLDTTDNNGGTNTWVAHSGYKLSGATPTGTAPNTGAFLPFTPVAGNVYTLSASYTGIGPDGTSVSWQALGFGKSVPSPFADGTDNRFISGATLGRAWFFFRPNNPTTPTDSPNKIQLGNSGTGTASSPVWTDATLARGEGGDIDLKIVLDTNPLTWTADFFAKRPTDSTYTDVSGGPLSLLAQDIGMVGVARTSGTLAGTLTKFMLEKSDTGLVPGDVDGDGDVDDTDFGIIRDHLFQNGTRAVGDLTGDGIVDFSDFRQWKTAHGGGAGSGASLSSVPEPASALFAVIAAFVGCTGLRLRGKRNL